MLTAKNFKNFVVTNSHLEAKPPLKNLFFTPKFFSAGFPQKFSSAKNFFTAGFELFCRIFGRLATVFRAIVRV
jgi:hypothetical protein